MNSKIDFINGETNKSLIKMFAPLMVGMIMLMIYNMVDGLWVGNLLGEQGMSALTAGTAIVLFLNSISMGVGNGISVMIANLVGADDRKHIPGAVATVIAVSTVFSIVLLILGEVLVGPILVLMGTPEIIFSDAATYLKIYLLGNAALFIYMVFTSIFRAFGDPMFQMKGMMLTAVFNAVVDPFAIKAYGLAGAAIVTVASEVLCLVYAIIYYRKKKMFSMDFKKINMNDAITMVRLSVPTTVQSIMPPLSSVFMISFISSFGMNTIAGFGVARNLELIMFMPTTGMCMAVTSIVGQCVGAKRHDRAMDYLKSSMIIGGSLIAITSVLVILFSGQLTAVFGQGAEVAQVVSRFFSIISIGYVLYMLTSCMQGYITGIGKPGMAMVLLVLYYIVFRIPTAYIFKQLFGLNGVWFAFLISHILSVVVAFVMVSYIQKTYSTENSICHKLGA